MATVSAFSSLRMIYKPNSRTSHFAPSHSLTFPTKPLHFQADLMVKYGEMKKGFGYGGLRMVRSSEEDESLVTETVAAEETTSEEQQPVAVPVSASDKLTMFFQADGTMNEAAIPAVTQALEETEGISDLKVQVVEGIATVELKKQTTVQSTGVAANLVETIQGSGFKLQTLNLSFEDADEFVLV